jgi:hypothetical protein
MPISCSRIASRTAVVVSRKPWLVAAFAALIGLAVVSGCSGSSTPKSCTTNANCAGTVNEDAGQDGAVMDSGSSDGPSVEGSGGPVSEASMLPGCTWPASLDLKDAANGQCVAARTVLHCTSSGGDEFCISDDPTQCPSGGQLPGVSGVLTCNNRCASTEYGVECEPPLLGASLPSGCRGTGGFPEVSFFCCPCGGTGTLDDAGTDGGSMTEAGGDVIQE